MSIERVNPRVRVEIDGQARALLGGDCASGTRAAFSTATVILDPSEGRPQPGATVRIWAGYDASLAPVFTGEIDANGVSLAPNELEVRATGILARTREAIGEPPTIVDGEAEQEYFLSWEGATAGTIIGDILSAYGIVARSIEDSAATYGNIEPVGLLAGDSGWSLIEQLDEVEGYKTFDAPDGVVRRVPQTGIPSGSGRTVEQGVDLYAGRLDESRTGTYNRVIASGLPQVGTTGVDFVPTEELSAPSPWIPTPPTYRAFSFASFLFEDADQCGTYAARKLGELNRLRGELPFDLALGDATLRPGMSVAVDSLVLDVRANVRFWVQEVRHDFGDGFNTSGTLLLASEGTGWSANLAPVAIIDAVAKVETLADATQIVTVSLDGSASYDPELGIAGVVSYAWDGDPEVPVAFDSAMRATVIYEDGIPEDAWIELTVTDDLGKTGTSRIEPGAGGLPLKTRDIIAGELTRTQATRDGGAAWTGTTPTIAGVVVSEFAAAEYALVATAAGTLYKVAGDNTATAVLAASGVTAVGITLLNGDPEQPTGRCWAGSSDGSIRRSRDDGATWETVAPAPNGEAVRHIQESPFAEGDVEIAAGNASYRSFDNGGSWVEQYAHPNTGLTLNRIAAGFGKSWFGFGGPLGGGDGGDSRLINREGTVDLDFPGADKPGNIVGLALDPFEDVIYVLDIDDGGNGRLWTGDSANGGLLVAAATWDDAEWGEPRHMIRDGTSPGYLYIAAEHKLLKSVDGLQTVLVLKDLSGGAEGMMLGYGAERVKTLTTTQIHTDAPNESVLRLWNGASTDAPPAGWYAAEYVEDAAWLPSVQVATSSGVDQVSDQLTKESDTEEILMRKTFTLPAGIIETATLAANGTEQPTEVYVNGVLVGGRSTGVGGDPFLTFDVAALLFAGASNVIAMRSRKVGGAGTTPTYPATAVFILDVNA